MTIISSFPKLLFTPRNKLEILIKVPGTFPPTPPLTQQFAISEKLVPTLGYGRKFPQTWHLFVYTLEPPLMLTDSSLGSRTSQ